VPGQVTINPTEGPTETIVYLPVCCTISVSVSISGSSAHNCVLIIFHGSVALLDREKE